MDKFQTLVKQAVFTMFLAMKAENSDEFAESMSLLHSILITMAQATGISQEEMFEYGSDMIDKAALPNIDDEDDEDNEN